MRIGPQRPVDALEDQDQFQRRTAQKFVDQTVPQADISTLRFPIRISSGTERGQHDFGEVNWDEFYQVVAGNGPCNRQRLRTR